jgi:hypothetical protein
MAFLPAKESEVGKKRGKKRGRVSFFLQGFLQIAEATKNNDSRPLFFDPKR